MTGGLDKTDDGLVIVRATLGLTKGFGLTATAEGIEDARQLACLKANGAQRNISQFRKIEHIAGKR